MTDDTRTPDEILAEVEWEMRTNPEGYTTVYGPRIRTAVRLLADRVKEAEGRLRWLLDRGPISYGTEGVDGMGGDLWGAPDEMLLQIDERRNEDAALSQEAEAPAFPEEGDEEDGPEKENLRAVSDAEGRGANGGDAGPPARPLVRKKPEGLGMHSGESGESVALPEDVEGLIDALKSDCAEYHAMCQRLWTAIGPVEGGVTEDPVDVLVVRQRDALQRELERVRELRLCESEHLVLKPDQLYRFTVDTECKRCVEIAALSRCKFDSAEGAVETCDGCIHRRWIEADPLGSSMSGWGCFLSGGHAIARCDSYAAQTDTTGGTENGE